MPEEKEFQWAAKDWTQGESNALVKKVGGDKIARMILQDLVGFEVRPPLKELAAFFAYGTESFELYAYLREHMANIQDINLYQFGFLGLVEKDIPSYNIASYYLEKDLNMEDVMALFGDRPDIHFFHFLRIFRGGIDAKHLYAFIRNKNGNAHSVLASRIMPNGVVSLFSQGNKGCVVPAGSVILARK